MVKHSHAVDVVDAVDVVNNSAIVDNSVSVDDVVCKATGDDGRRLVTWRKDVLRVWRRMVMRLQQKIRPDDYGNCPKPVQVVVVTSLHLCGSSGLTKVAVVMLMVTALVLAVPRIISVVGPVVRVFNDRTVVIREPRLLIISVTGVVAVAGVSHVAPVVAAIFGAGNPVQPVSVIVVVEGIGRAGFLIAEDRIQMSLRISSDLVSMAGAIQKVRVIGAERQVQHPVPVSDNRGLRRGLRKQRVRLKGLPGRRRRRGGGLRRGSLRRSRSGGRRRSARSLRVAAGSQQAKTCQQNGQTKERKLAATLHKKLLC